MTTKKEALDQVKKIDEDEPVFVLRGKDPISPMVVELYALQATIYHVNPNKVDEVRKLAKEMRTWHAQQRKKVLHT